MSANSYREDNVRVKTTLREVLQRLWPFFMRQRVLFFSILAAVFAVAASARLAVNIFGRAIDDGILKNDRNVIIWATSAYFLLEVGRNVMTFLQSYFFSRLGNRILFELRSDLVQHTQSLPTSFFDRNPTGRIVTRLTNDVVSLGELFTQGLISVFAAFVSLIAIIIAMSAISVKMTLVTLVAAPPLVIVAVYLNRKILEALRESKAKLAAINAFVAENIGGMRILQLYGRVDRNRQRFEVLSSEYRDKMLRSVKLYALLWPASSFFNAASVSAALFIGGSMALAGTVTTGAMIAFILHVRAFIEPLNAILEKYQILQSSLSGAERIFTLQDEEPETSMNGSLGRLRGEIRFDQLSFRYSPLLPDVLKNVDIHIQPGESIAIVGRTGSGKSTLISLLQRMHDPSKGMIYIDGQPINSLPRRGLRGRVGVVQQDAFMFRGTIADNIGLGCAEISRGRIEEASHGARLDEMLMRHPSGLESRVEERGANLSFGERQLLAFARILAFDPDILILDEATANIDSHTEQLIQEATQRVRRGRTSLIIAHRISTILDCDRIVLMDHGRIAEIGSHAELYAHGGMYRALCDAQFREAAVEPQL
jgi:ATP-binding cassette subfamily B multidrug efflux pump